MPIINWIKSHKATTFLFFIILLLLAKQNGNGMIPYASRSYSGIASDTVSAPSALNMSAKMALPTTGGGINSYSEAAPQSVSNRMTIQESNMSLQVKNVTETRDNIINFAQTNGGYMVNSGTSNPQDNPTATLTIRIAADKIKAALNYFRTLSVKVVSENLSGYDVTDQYVDIDKHIAILEATKLKFQSILDQAKEISDITNLNQQIIEIQNQIDSYKGQQVYLKQNADLAKMTIYLATDEIALPYAPSETWRPEVIFKEAVRSMVADLRHFASSIIWIGVYAVIWIPIAVVAYLVYRFVLKRKTNIPAPVTRKSTSTN
jgi:hypothetical protein